jgi:hypothetical protein
MERHAQLLRTLIAAGLLLAGASLDAPAGTRPCPASLPEPAEGAGLHAPFDRVLKAVVEGSLVDYDCLREHRWTLDAYREELADVSLEALSEDERIALWINAYNAATLELILRHLPGIDSIKDIPRSERWKAEDWTVAGERVSLDAMEHDILRVRFDEPRIHMAVNCASLGCPDLRPEAYVAARLDAQLDDATRRFLADEEKGARTGMAQGLLWGETPTLWLSSIFDWFEEDFESAGGVVAFVLPHLEENDASFVREHREGLAVDHLDYDWGLNDLAENARSSR